MCWMSPDTAATVFHVFFMVFSFVMGITWGSFFNVCVYRVPVGKSIVRPGSHCYSCGTFLKWYDNIPLLSYVLLGGNCRYCGSHFSARYFLVELLSGVLFVLTYLQFGAGITMPLAVSTKAARPAISSSIAPPSAYRICAKPCACAWCSPS